MSDNNKKDGIKLKSELRKIIVKIGCIMEEEPKLPNTEFIFRFSYLTRGIQILKLPKKGWLEFSHSIAFSSIHMKEYNKLNMNNQTHFKIELLKLLLDTISEHNLQLIKDKGILMIGDSYFLDGSKLNINELYRIIKKLSLVGLRCNIFIRQFFNTNMDDFNPITLD